MLQPAEVHVWSVMVGEMPETEHSPAHISLLSEIERQRMQRLRMPIDRRMFGVSHVLLRRVLARYLNEPPGGLEFSRGKHGKPALVRAPGRAVVEFNLTHTKGLAAVVVAANRAVGIDAERGDRFINDDLAARIFSDDERRFLAETPSEERASRMVRLWTLKEAYVKALGVGLSVSVADLSFQLKEGDAPRLTGDPTRWRFLELDAPSPYILSIAVEMTGQAAPRLCTFDGAELV